MKIKFEESNEWKFEKVMIKVDLSLKNWKRLVKFKNGKMLKDRNIKEMRNIQF